MREKINEKNVEVLVNLQENIATIQIRKELFFKLKSDPSVERFIIYSEYEGASYIDKVGGKYYFKIIAKNEPGIYARIVEEREITEGEARRIIRDIIKERIMDKVIEY